MMQYRETTLDKQDSTEVKNFTRSPNMLIFGYRDISPQEKWLYICLKHMCGKRGTRHLSLRYISEQTGISTGALSKSKHSEGMIRHLHDAGLIHAEIKRHDGKGNPQYHITITDVWALNQAFFNKTCSDFGQDEDIDAEPVRNSDEPVQISDKLVQISDEPVRNSGNTKIRDKTTNKITEQNERSTIWHTSVPVTDLQKWKEESDKHKAVDLSHSQMDIGKDEDDGILDSTGGGSDRDTGGNREDVHRNSRGDTAFIEEEDTAKVPAVKIGGNDANTVSRGVPGKPGRDISSSPIRHTDHSDTHNTITSQQKPDAGSLTSVVNPPVGGQDDASVQASGGLVVSLATPAQHAGDTLGTLATAGAVQAVIPKRPRYRKPLTMEKAQLTLEGANVKQWYEEVRGVKVRMIDKNITDLNALGAYEELSKEALQATIEHLDHLKWVIEHDYAIDLHVLAGDGQLNFENNWPLVKRKLAFKAKQEERDNGDYTDFDIYVGNGPEERAALIAQYEVRKANGTLAW